MFIINPSRFESGSSNGLLTNLVNYYTLDETSGTRSDSHGTDDLAEENTVTSETGINSNGAYFVETNDELLVNAAYSTINWAESPWTVSFWMNPDGNMAANDYVCAMRFGTAGGDRAFYVTFVGGAFKFRYFNGANQDLLFSGYSGTDTASYNHIVVSWDGSSTMRNWVNGGTVQSLGSITPDTKTADARFTIGGTNTTGAYTGGVDEFATWNRVLSDADVANLYNSGSGLFLSSFD